MFPERFLFPDVLLFVVRSVLGIFFLKNGANHLVFGTDDLTSWSDYKGLPAPRLSVVLSGLVLTAGGFALLVGLFVEAAAVVLAAFLVVAALLMHRYWSLGPADAAAQNPHFWKNIALAAATLLFLIV